MNQNRVVIIGGGITGLSAAHYVREMARRQGMSADITLFEADDRFGGKVRTLRTDKHTLESGPDSIFTPKFKGIDLLCELGLENDVVPVNAGGSYMYRRGNLLPLPRGMSFGIPSDIGAFAKTKLLSPQGKLRALLDVVMPGEGFHGDVSIGEFLRRRLGNELVDVMAAPMLAGIHAADIDRLSLDAAMPSLRKMYEEHHSLVLGVMAAREQALRRHVPSQHQREAPSPVFISLKHGLESMIDKLVDSLRSDVKLVTSVSVLQVTSSREDGFCSSNSGENRRNGPPARYAISVEGKGGVAQTDADAVIVALPADGAARVLQGLPTRLEALRRMRYASTATILLGYEAGQVPVMPGSGFLVPSTEGTTITACTVVSNKWPHAVRGGETVLRCYVGRDGREDIVNSPDPVIAKMVSDDLEPLMGRLPKPTFVHVTRWHRSMPQYDVGHLNRVAEVERETAKLPGLELAGAAYRGVGIPDCIRDGIRAATRTVDYLSEESRVRLQ